MPSWDLMCTCITVMHVIRDNTKVMFYHITTTIYVNGGQLPLQVNDWGTCTIMIQLQHCSVHVVIHRSTRHPISLEYGRVRMRVCECGNGQNAERKCGDESVGKWQDRLSKLRFMDTIVSVTTVISVSVTPALLPPPRNLPHTYPFTPAHGIYYRTTVGLLNYR